MNNQVQLIGHVGQNPQVKTFEDTGNRVAKFSLAVKVYSSKTDEEITNWFDIDSWNGLADRVSSTITKGREVVVHGELLLNRYKKTVDGVTFEVEKPYVKLSGFHLCGRKPTSQDQTETKKPRQARSLAKA